MSDALGAAICETWNQLDRITVVSVQVYVQAHKKEKISHIFKNKRRILLDNIFFRKKWFLDVRE